MRKSIWITSFAILTMISTGSLFASRRAPAPAPKPAAPTAGEKTIYIHGFSLTSSNASCQGKSKCGYWSQQTGNAVHVGYDGRLNPTHSYSTSGKTRLLAILNQYCRRSKGQSCRIVCHSMGCYTSSYVVAQYNRGNTYRINYVASLASAEGGSELANIGTGAIKTLARWLGGWFGGVIADLVLYPAALNALKTSYARSAFDHNRNNGILFYHTAGNDSAWYADWIYPGKDDRVVGFHSTCAYRSIKAFSRCGGESVRSCSWCFWQKKKNVSPWSGHKSSTSYSRYGVKETHNNFQGKNKYHRK